jgi:hypothetical protein
VVLSLHVLRVKSDEMRLRVKSEERAQKHREKREHREKKEKKSDEMRLGEKNRQYILGGLGPANSFFNRIQNVYKVYSSFSVKSYCILCKIFRDRELI